jgi:hypothetical protein
MRYSRVTRVRGGVFVEIAVVVHLSGLVASRRPSRASAYGGMGRGGLGGGAAPGVGKTAEDRRRGALANTTPL